VVLAGKAYKGSDARPDVLEPEAEGDMGDAGEKREGKKRAGMVNCGCKISGHQLYKLLLLLLLT
jgi:hypothetical protein